MRLAVGDPVGVERGVNFLEVFYSDESLLDGLDCSNLEELFVAPSDVSLLVVAGRPYPKGPRARNSGLFLVCVFVRTIIKSNKRKVRFVTKLLQSCNSALFAEVYEVLDVLCAFLTLFDLAGDKSGSVFVDPGAKIFFSEDRCEFACSIVECAEEHASLLFFVLHVAGYPSFYYNTD